MSKHRMKCMNAQCQFEGMMDATAERQFVKPHFREMQRESHKKQGTTAAPEVMQIRCPKCGARWRVRADRLR